MTRKLIVNNLTLGDQFSAPSNIAKEVKISDIYYNFFKKNTNIIIRDKDFILLPDKIILNIVDIHDVNTLSERTFIAGLKFLIENEDADTYVHCQLGVSRSPSLVFIYLVSQKFIKADNFSDAIADFIDNFYPYMKLNQGVFDFLKTKFPFVDIAKKAKQEWGNF
ncbi:dual specificity phosphatase, catalytic domain protein [Mesoplasma syrphidae]|uniref:Dual specificity phosphatase, catalytic domain protein n=1 Tax=Mesoplasma syrphidae TaxID=225999 RepID=A0A2K9BIV2_9MOLU|nr:dual specificity protein phosphatase family protein [Mesoplasma syrphidae]AUF83216.1 dual specificity phosphatase, catalytic domain protein [Mesoplasma syrphidae]